MHNRRQLRPGSRSTNTSHLQFTSKEDAADGLPARSHSMSTSLRCKNLEIKAEKETRGDRFQPLTFYMFPRTVGQTDFFLFPTDVSDPDQGRKCASVCVCACVHGFCVLCVCVCMRKRVRTGGLQSVIMRIISPVMRKGCTRPPHTGLVAHKHWSHRWTKLRRLLWRRGRTRDSRVGGRGLPGCRKPLGRTDQMCFSGRG